MKVRNENLYRLLRREFGEVRVGKPGEPMAARFRKDAITGKVSLLDGDWGETYNVCCPCCGDTRFRLCFSHMTFEKVRGPSGLFKIRKWHCFNEGCERNENGELNRRVFSLDGPQRVFGRHGVKSILEIAPAEEKKIELPPGAMPVLSLPEGHVALWYLLEHRGFRAEDVKKLDFRWVENPRGAHPFNRLVCPLYVKGAEGPVLKGWQARFLRDDGDDVARKELGEIKWHTAAGTRKGSLLYNHANVVNSIVVAATEGPFDVAGGVGPEAGVALWGKAISKGQRNLLRQPWGGKDSVLVLALDGDAYALKAGGSDSGRLARQREIDDLLQFEAEARKSWSWVIRLDFRADQDPGNTPRTAIWNEVYRQLRRMGAESRIPAVSSRVLVLDDRLKEPDARFFRVQETATAAPPGRGWRAQ